MFSTLNFFNHKMDLNILLESLNKISWHEVLKGNHANSMLDLVHTMIYDKCFEHLPIKTTKEQKKNSIIIQYRRSLTKRRRKIKKRVLTATSPTAKDLSGQNQK